VVETQLDVTEELAAGLLRQVVGPHADATANQGRGAQDDVPRLRQADPNAGACDLMLDVTLAWIPVKDDRGHRHPAVAAPPPTFGADAPGSDEAGLISQVDLADPWHGQTQGPLARTPRVPVCGTHSNKHAQDDRSSFHLGQVRDSDRHSQEVTVGSRIIGVGQPQEGYVRTSVRTVTVQRVRQRVRGR
jgi:hypothetical protein